MTVRAEVAASRKDVETFRFRDSLTKAVKFPLKFVIIGEIFLLTVSLLQDSSVSIQKHEVTAGDFLQQRNE